MGSLVVVLALLMVFALVMVALLMVLGALVMVRRGVAETIEEALPGLWRAGAAWSEPWQASSVQGAFGAGGGGKPPPTRAS